ncbi:MAG: DMT family protein [Segetibacter sp.]
MKTISLLIVSNIFMTFAWYWHLKDTGIPLWKAIIISWGIAFFEYCLTVPANRIGFTSGWNGFQLKIIQEVITLVIFSFFAVLYLKEPFHWKYLVSFAFILGAVYFAFKNKRCPFRNTFLKPAK